MYLLSPFTNEEFAIVIKINIIMQIESLGICNK